LFLSSLATSTANSTLVFDAVLGNKELIANGIFDAISESPELSARLTANNVTKENAIEIKDIISEHISITELLEVANRNITWDTELEEGGPSVGQKVEEIYAAITTNEKVIAMNDKLNTKLKDQDTKVEFAVDVAKELRNKSKLVEEKTYHNNVLQSPSIYKIEIDKSTETLNSINDLVEEYFNSDVQGVESSYIAVLDKVEEKVNDVMQGEIVDADGNQYIDNTMLSSIYGILSKIDENLVGTKEIRTNDQTPSDGSGGGGGGVPTPTTPKVEEPKVENGEAKVELGKDASKTTTGTKGQSVVTVKSENIKAAGIAINTSSIFFSFTILPISSLVPKIGTPLIFLLYFSGSSSITPTGYLCICGLLYISLIIIEPAFPPPITNTLFLSKSSLNKASFTLLIIR